MNARSVGESSTTMIFLIVIVALFARLARQKQALEIYEDGRILRDFVYIDDVVSALFAAIFKIMPNRAIEWRDVDGRTRTAHAPRVTFARADATGEGDS